MQIGDLHTVLKDSEEDQEMQRMAEQEQQELQQQVCSVRLQAALSKPVQNIQSNAL